MIAPKEISNTVCKRYSGHSDGRSHQPASEWMARAVMANPIAVSFHSTVPGLVGSFGQVGELRMFAEISLDVGATRDHLQALFARPCERRGRQIPGKTLALILFGHLDVSQIHRLEMCIRDRSDSEPLLGPINDGRQSPL